MKKKIALVTAVLLLFCTACSEPPTQADSGEASLDVLTNTENVKGAAMEIAYSNSWASEKLLPDVSFSQIMPVGDCLLLTCSQQEVYRKNSYLYDPASGSLTEPLHCMQERSEEDIVEITAAFAEEDGYTVIYSIHALDEKEIPTENIWYAERYDADWNYLSELELTEFLTPEQTLVSIAPTADGYCMIEGAWGSGNYRYVNKDWSSNGSMAGVSGSPQLLTGADGALYLYTDRGFTLLDPETQTKKQLRPEGLPEEISGVCSGYGETAFCVYNSTGVWAVHTDMTSEQIVDWAASDFIGDYMNGIQLLPDGRICASNYGDDRGIWLLTQRTEEEMQSMELITLASLTRSNDIAGVVNDFNRQSKGIRIVMQDYGEYYDETSDLHFMDKCVEMFEKDLLSGKIPDIICTYGLPWENYVDKGLFEDLYQWMEADESFHQEDYMMNFYDALGYQGKLYRFGYAFTIRTVAGKTRFVGDQQGLTVAGYNALAQSLPEGMAFEYAPTNWTVLQYFRNAIYSMVDTEKAECHFDSPDMIAFLEFCNTFPSDRTIYDMDANDGLQYQNDTVCLSTVSIRQPEDYTRICNQFGGDPITLIGYPTPDGSSNGAQFGIVGEMAMYSQSAHKAEIWGFFRSLISGETQDAMQQGCAVNRASLRKQMEQAIQDGQSTQAQMDAFLALADQTTESDYYNFTINAIVQEETDMFFAGDQTAEQAVRNMQSRVGLYLAERS